MPHRDAPAICRKIDHALNYMRNDGDELMPWLRWQLGEILAGPKHITLEDCEAPELMALLAILAPIFSRHLAGTVVPGSGLDEGGEGTGKLLTLILGDRGDDSAGTA